VPKPTEAPESGVDRRSVLRLGSGGAVALVLGVGVGWLDRRGGASSPDPLADFLAAEADATESTLLPATTPPTTTAPVTLAEIGDVDPGIIVLGHRALELHDLGGLDELLATFPAPGSSIADPVLTAATLTATEFRNGDTLVVDGWILAASEVRAAAALALMCDEVSC
jgi:hypothetical protein